MNERAYREAEATVPRADLETLTEPVARPVSGPGLSGYAAGAIVSVWGGILVIAQIERGLPVDRQWWGHAFVHLWTATFAVAIAVVAVRLLRTGRVPSGPLRWATGTTAVLAVGTAVGGYLDAVGAYPTMRAFHDVVTLVAAPVQWLLLASLVAVVAIGVVTTSGDGRAAGSAGRTRHARRPSARP
jgi:hypothetical protein